MADLATLGVRVTTSGIREAERDLKGLSKEGARTAAQADKIGQAWGKSLGVAVLAGTAVLGVGLARVIKNTLEAEKVQAQLAARIRSTGGAAGLAVADLNKMADALQAATTFDDEAIGGAQALLLTFTKIGKDVFPSATEAVLNLSTAMGTDLSSAALQVGKALNDPVQGVNALARAGVTFSESQKETIKQLVETGRQAEAQRIVLQELETQMGGSARAARDTLGGALVGLGNAFDNLLEGETGGDGVRGAKSAIEQLTATLSSQEVKEGFGAITEGIASVTAEILGGIGTIAQYIGEYQKLAALRSGSTMATDAGDTAVNQRIAELTTRIEKLRGAESKGTFGLGGGLDTSVLATVFGQEDEAARASRLASPGVDFYSVKGELDTLIAERTELIREGTRRILRDEAAAASGGAGRSGGVRMQDGENQVINAGADFRTGGGARGTAGSVASAVSAAEEKRTRDMLDLQREMADAQASVQTATENLRAELGGPFAQVQLEYIRREDELISLAKLAGLSQEELTESLGLLEQARLVDVAAIDKQIEAERRRAKEIADQPLIAQLDGLRDTTAGFFVDLVKNGKSAVDALQDYLLTSALQSIGKQIAEGLFGNFGTTDSGSAGSGIAGFLTSLLGGGRAIGGRAIGGPVSANRLYQVGEKGQPELLEVHGKKFLIPGGNGNVTPSSAGGGGRDMAPIYQTINVTGTIDNRSASQLATETARTLSRAQRRT